MQDLLAKSEKNRLLSVMVRLKVDRDAGGKAKPSAIKAAQEKLQQGLSGTGFRVKRLFRHIPFATLEVDPGSLRRLVELDVVAGVSEEAEYYSQLEQTTHLVNAPWSFRQAFSGKGAAVAIIDSGVVPHSFFGDRLVEEFCFSSPGSDAESLCRDGESEDSGPGAACASPDFCDHGTHVTGIAAGEGGIARRANIIALNVSVKKTHFLAGPYKSYLNGDVVAALEKVLELADTHNIAAVNMSIGRGPFTQGPCDQYSENEQAILAVVNLLKLAGVAAIAASGNDGDVDKLDSPACISTVISVGATDDNRAVASLSNSSQGLDLLAPGVDVRSSVPGGFEACGQTPTGGFASCTGTSMAAPHVTGAWAVLKAKNALARVDDIAAALRQSGLEITDERQGRETPMIQIEEAMQLILQPHVRIYPANGPYQTPHQVHIHVAQSAGLARDLKTWVTTNGDAPTEDAPGSTLLCEEHHCDFHILTLDQPGTIVVSATPFFALLNGTRVPARGAAAIYVLREPAPGPSSVTASDGTFLDRVRVAWASVADADEYEVFGSLSDRTPGPLSRPLNQIRVAGTSFDHFTTLGTGAVFHYFVRARVNGSPTLFGGPDTGYSQVASIPVQATDGTAPGGIRLDWDPTPWKTPGVHVVYEIYRSTDSDVGHATLIATREGTFINNYPAGVIIEAASKEYFDADVLANQTYFYWVKGIDGSDESRLGQAESGSRAP
jgi:subtilisin family serine protease